MEEQRHRLDNTSTQSRPLEHTLSNENQSCQNIGVSAGHQQMGRRQQIVQQLYPVEQKSAQANAQRSHSETPGVNESTRSHESATSENPESGSSPKACGKGEKETQPDFQEDSVHSSSTLPPEVQENGQVEVEDVKADVATERPSNHIVSVTVEEIPCVSGPSRILSVIPCSQHGRVEWLRFKGRWTFAERPSWFDMPEDWEGWVKAPAGAGNS